LHSLNTKNLLSTDWEARLQIDKSVLNINKWARSHDIMNSAMFMFQCQGHIQIRNVNMKTMDVKMCHLCD
jgi:hypothetical protein